LAILSSICIFFCPGGIWDCLRKRAGQLPRAGSSMIVEPSESDVEKNQNGSKGAGSLRGSTGSLRGGSLGTASPRGGTASLGTATPPLSARRECSATSTAPSGSMCTAATSEHRAVF
jgi:hypothetical protein